MTAGQMLFTTDTDVVTYPGFQEVHPEAWRALMAWCEFHGIDPKDVPAAGVIHRDVDARCVRYARFVRDEAGKRVPVTGPLSNLLTCELEDAVAQGETPPLPWPPEVAALPLSTPTTETA